MPILTAKLLKIGGPILTGIGGVIATSSLVSTNADEKPEEKLKTKSLADEDPLIEEYKDQDESEQQESSQSEDSKEPPAEEGEKQEGGGGENPPVEGKEDKASEGGEESESSKQPPSLQVSDGAEGDQISLDVVEAESQGQNEKSDLSEVGENSIEGEGPEESKEDISDLSGNDEEEEGTLGAVVAEGASDAENLNINGTSIGTEDVAMTEQDVQEAKKLVSNLEDIKNQLLKL